MLVEMIMDFPKAIMKSMRRLSQPYYCPVCERRTSGFLPLPSVFEENAKKYGYSYFGQGETINIQHYSCPHCGASDRERLYALYMDLEQYIRPCKFKPKLLHIAPETALSARIRRMRLFEYITADYEMECVDEKVDLTSMTMYMEHSFDCFICSHVLEHIIDDDAAIAELFRVLKPGGWGILMSPVMTHLEETQEDPSVTDEVDRWRLYGQGDHVRLYAKRDFMDKIRLHGFALEQLGINYFGDNTFDEAGITKQSILYVGRKPE